MQRHFLDVVVFRIESANTDVLHRHLLHAIDAIAILVIVFWSQELLHLLRHRMLLANHLQETDTVERKHPNLFIFLHSYHVPPLLVVSHESGSQHHIALRPEARHILKLQQILLVYRRKDIIQIFRVVRRRIEHHLIVIPQHITQRGKSKGTQHPFRHIVTLHCVTLDVIPVTIALVALHTDAKLRLNRLAIAMKSSQLQFILKRIGRSVTPLIRYLLKGKMLALQESDQPTIKLYPIVHNITFFAYLLISITDRRMQDFRLYLK